MLTSRELASLIWLGVMAIVVAMMALRDRSLARSIGNVAVTALRPPILTVIVVFFVYLACCLWVAERLGVWNSGLAKETVIWAVVSGMAVVFSATNANDPSYFRQAIRRTFAATVLIEFFFGLASFPLAVELIIQPALTLVVILEVVARGKEEAAQVASCLGTVLAIAGFAFALGTGVAVWRSRSSIDWSQQGLEFALLLWLPLIALPYVYVLAWGMNYGVLMSMIRWQRDDRPVPLSTRAGIAFGFNVAWRHLGQARIDPARDLAGATSLSEAYGIVRRFRRSLGTRTRQDT